MGGRPVHRGPAHCRELQPPRAWAFALLGLDAHCSAAVAISLRARLADRLLGLLATVETPDWIWFEDGLSYDNARLPQALIATGLATKEPAYIEAGPAVAVLAHTSPDDAGHGLFRPIGSESFGDRRSVPKAFDQQCRWRLATAAISACLAAWRADGDPEWRNEAARAFAWFLGDNDLSTPLVDLDTGACRDGLHRDRPNENRGGESVVSYLLSLAEICQLARVTGDRPKLAPLRVLHARSFCDLAQTDRRTSCPSPVS